MDRSREELAEYLTAENIIPVLIAEKGNEALLEKVPHVLFHDLEIIFKFMVPNNRESMPDVTNMFMEQQGWDAEELLEIAKRNLKNREQARVLPMKKAAEESLRPIGQEPIEENLEFIRETRETMVMLTNCSEIYGAACILDDGLMKKIGEAFEGDMYIIPASVNYCILVQAEIAMLEDLQRMLRESNKLIPQQEWLSDEVYYYDACTREIVVPEDGWDEYAQIRPAAFVIHAEGR